MKKNLLSPLTCLITASGYLYSMQPAQVKTWPSFADQPSAYLAPNNSNNNFNNLPQQTRIDMLTQAALSATKKITREPAFLSDLPTTPKILKNKKGDTFIDYINSNPKQDLTPGAFNATVLGYAYTPSSSPLFNIYLTTHPRAIGEGVQEVDEIAELEIDLSELPQKTVIVHKYFHDNQYGEFALKLAIEISRELKAKKIEIFDLEKNNPQFSQEEITGIPWAPELLEKCGFTAGANGKWVLNL